MYFSEEIDGGNLVVTCLISNRSWAAPASNVIAKASARESARSWQESLISKIGGLPKGYFLVSDLTAAAQRASLI
jgi:hypothetical protein